MIESIKIRNFLSHKKTNITFHPGVNIIVGESDTGKSAIIRALRWAITNRPGGDDLRSTWGGDTSIVLKLGGSSTPPCSITRMKGKGGNGYTLTREVDGVDSHMVFKAIKTAVPDEIAEALNMDMTNIQTQFESHFLLSRSPGEVAQHFNKVAHLDKIDLGLVNIAREIRANLSAITAEEAAIHRLGEEFADFDDIDIIEHKVEALEAIQLEVDELYKGIETILGIEKLINKLTESIAEYEEEVKLSPLVDSLLELYKEKQNIEWSITDAGNMVKDILAVEHQIERYSKILEHADLVNGSLAVLEEIRQQEIALDEAFELIEALSDVESEIKLTTVALEVAEEKFHKNIGEVCPLCGNKIK